MEIRLSPVWFDTGNLGIDVKLVGINHVPVILTLDQAKAIIQGLQSEVDRLERGEGLPAFPVSAVDQLQALVASKFPQQLQQQDGVNEGYMTVQKYT